MKIRSLVLSVAVAAASLWPVAVAPAACAGEAPRAVLVVDTGETALNFCVTLPGDSVSGIELVKLASKQHGLSYKLGFGGAAVCHLAGVGPTGNDCFEQDPDFWGYWRGDGSGGWTWGSTGAGSTSVTDGSVEGWAWGSGTGPETHPAPPPTRFADVCAPAAPGGKKETGNSDEEPAAPQEPESKPAPAPAAGSTSSSGDASKTKRSRDQGKERPTTKRTPRSVQTPEPAVTPSPVPTSSSPELAGSELASDSDGGPPAAGVAALAGTLVLIGGGALVARRRRTQ